MTSTEQFYQELNEQLKRVNGKSAAEVAADEQFWLTVRKAYITEPGFINMNNGGVNPQPLPVREAVINNYLFSNKGPTYYMWKVLDAKRETLRQRLADFIHADHDEVAITRNTTESLDAIINGLTLNPGDEVVLSRYDYPNMIFAWKQREIRDGIRINWVDPDLSEEEPDRIIEKYISHFSQKTKVLLLPHIINWTGQVLPVKEIIAEAKSRGIETILDAAHSFATLDIDIKDLDPDYMGTSLHKWLGAPFGTGFLYVKKEKISKLFPLFANENPQSADIRKFEWQGTRCFPLDHGISEALDLHLMLGTHLKRARLNFLRDYWVERVKNIPGVHIITPSNPMMASSLVTFSVDQMDPMILEKKLLDNGIAIAAFVWEDLKGIRITPNVYTTTDEIEAFVRVFSEIIRTEV